MSTDEFTVSIPTDGDTLRGKFKVKLKLSFRERLRMDELRRSLLGEKSTEASPEANGIASALAKIQIHLLEGPSWWKDAANGLEFDDTNIVLSVLEELNKVELAYQTKLKKTADADREQLNKKE